MVLNPVTLIISLDGQCPHCGAYNSFFNDDHYQEFHCIICGFVKYGEGFVPINDTDHSGGRHAYKKSCRNY